MPSALSVIGSSEDSSGSGSTELDSDTVSSEDHDPKITTDADDPKMTSDPEMTSDSGTSSDSETSSDEDDTRTAVLEAALLHVPSLGWTPAALEEGAKDQGLTEAAKNLFSR